ncbi:MAG: hypothetical protein KDB80_11065 [Planctomycetes bacterium]|nr:hypothetical protein [Planctomycetota bacterium]
MRNLIGLTAIMLLCSCSWIEGLVRSPGEESPATTEQSYLQAGPNTDIELGQDERTLLEDYKKLNDTKIQLETKLGELTAENEQLRAQLGRTEKERDQFRNHFSVAEQDGERLTQRARDLEAKVLSLNIEKTVLEQELLRMRISSLRQQYESLVSAPATPARGQR